MSIPVRPGRRVLAARATLACLLTACATARPSTVASHLLVPSAPISDVRYDVTANPDLGRRHTIGVTMRFHVSGPGPVVLALPAWSPGHYELLWFASHVLHFSAESGGHPLEWHKLDYQTWQIAIGGASEVTVSFTYRADWHDRAAAQADSDLAFFEGTNLFMYPVGQGFDWPATVVIHADPSYRIATGMTPTGADTFSERNYHDLVDMPFVIGHIDFDSTLAGGTWLRLATYPAGAMPAATRQGALAALARLLPVESAVFHDTPFRVYTVLQLADGVVNGGGLEHQNSQLDGVRMAGADPVRLSSLYAHEMFHAWNVKRLRPADMVPYRYDDAQPTPWLWVSEGITDYYAMVARARSGIIDSTQFLATAGVVVATVVSNPPVALGDASLSSWVGSMDGTFGLYYPKGALAGMLLDILIRDGSDNHRSLDTVMRELYDTRYREHWTGFTAADWWSAVSRAAGGGSFADFDRHYITGRDPMPIDSVFALAGLRVSIDSVRDLRLGVGVASGDSCVRVVTIVPGGAAADAGIQQGDCIVSVGDVPVPTDDALAAVRQRYRGASIMTIPVTVRRGDRQLTITVPARFVTQVTATVGTIPNAGPKARGILEGMLHGSR